jgi:hypothetical protein
MELAVSDFKRVWPNLLLLIVCAVATAATVLVARHLTDRAETSAAKTRLDQVEAGTRLARARDEEQELRDKIARYRALETRGLIGDEHRLDWLERIRSIKLARKLIDVQYEMQPQQPIDPSLLTNAAGDIEFMSSSMQLHLLLLHEQDLLNFIADLRAGVDAFVRVRQCKVERIPANVRMAQLRADCVLDWITLRRKKGGAP